MAMLPYVPPPSGSNPVWYPINAAQTTELESVADALLYGGGSGGGKGLALDTPLPTPSGFVLMRDVGVGDVLFAADGSPCSVVGVSEISHRRCFRICFDDGSHIVADDVHRWRTLNYRERRKNDRRSEAFRMKRREDRPSRAKANPVNAGSQANVTAMNRNRVYEYAEPTNGSIVDTAAIRTSLYTAGMHLNHCVPLALPIKTAEAVLPVDPYTFGLWLGDGMSSQPSIGMLEDDLREILQHVPYAIRSERMDLAGTRGYKRNYLIVRFQGLKAGLVQSGAWKNKHIPDCYLRASVEQRLELLRGLLDTDGHCDKRGMIEIGLSDEKFCHQVAELLCSLGMKGTPRPKATYAKTSWRLKFMCPFPAFKLLRKRTRQHTSCFRDTVKRRYISGVEEVAGVPTRCIAVDSSDNMYLAGQQMVPTHNTDVLVADAMQERDNPNLRGLIIRRSFTDFTQIQDRCNALYKPFGGRWNEKYKTWRFPSGATIRFAFMKYDKDWESFQGAPFSFLGIDEGGHQTEARIRKILPWFATIDRSLRRRMRITANPGGVGAGWLMNMFLGGQCPIHAKPRAIEPGAIYRGSRWMDGKPTNLTTAFVPALAGDNPYYGEEKIAMLRSQEGSMADKLLLGCWCELEGAYFPFIKPDERFQYPLARLNPRWWWNHFISIDYGFGNSAAAAMLYASSPDGTIYVVEEMVEKRMSSTQFAEQILTEWVDARIGVEQSQRTLVGAYYDPAMDSHTGTGKSNADLMAEVFELRGLTMIKAAKDRIGGAQRAYRDLENGLVVLCDTVPKMYESLRTRMHDDTPGRGADVKKVHGDPFDDCYDSFIYGINNYAPETDMPEEVAAQRRLREMQDAGMDQHSLMVNQMRMTMDIQRGANAHQAMRIGGRRRR